MFTVMLLKSDPFRRYIGVVFPRRGYFVIIDLFHPPKVRGIRKRSLRRKQTKATVKRRRKAITYYSVILVRLLLSQLTIPSGIADVHTKSIYHPRRFVYCHRAGHFSCGFDHFTFLTIICIFSCLFISSHKHSGLCCSQLHGATGRFS